MVHQKYCGNPLDSRKINIMPSTELSALVVRRSITAWDGGLVGGIFRTEEPPGSVVEDMAVHSQAGRYLNSGRHWLHDGLRDTMGIWGRWRLLREVGHPFRCAQWISYIAWKSNTSIVNVRNEDGAWFGIVVRTQRGYGGRCTGGLSLCGQALSTRRQYCSA